MGFDEYFAKKKKYDSIDLHSDEFDDDIHMEIKQLMKSEKIFIVSEMFDKFDMSVDDAEIKKDDDGNILATPNDVKKTINIHGWLVKKIIQSPQFIVDMEYNDIGVFLFDVLDNEEYEKMAKFINDAVQIKVDDPSFREEREGDVGDN